jgi:hypothetical protein
MFRILVIYMVASWEGTSNMMIHVNCQILQAKRMTDLKL